MRGCEADNRKKKNENNVLLLYSFLRSDECCSAWTEECHGLRSEAGVQTIAALYTATTEGSFQKWCETLNYSAKTWRMCRDREQAEAFPGVNCPFKRVRLTTLMGGTCIKDSPEFTGEETDPGAKDEVPSGSWLRSVSFKVEQKKTCLSSPPAESKEAIS